MAQRENVTVLVLGDIGRSPRMQYHSLSLADIAGCDVDLVGYGGSKPHENLSNNNHITVHSMTPFRHGSPSLKMLFIFYAAWKITHQICQLFYYLLREVKHPRYVLVQNPPTIPTLFVVHVVCWIRGARLVIDWHNFGYSLLEISVGDALCGLIVWLARWFEEFFGRGAYANFCVTQAMQEELSNFGVDATVLYDRPPEYFRRMTTKEQHELFMRLERNENLQCIPDWVNEEKADGPMERSITTEKARNKYHLREDRPALIVSSTSWTPDEDFSILLDAVKMIEARSEKMSIPKILFMITGKGAQKEMYEQQIRKLNLKRTKIITMWLEAEDYPKLLGCCDIGVSLHTSSSGVDLPMKVVDMFGCQLPVCAINFSCISELVNHGVNGLIFDDSEQLHEQICQLLGKFPDNTESLDHMRDELKRFQQLRWSDSWREHALPIFSRGN